MCHRLHGGKPARGYARALTGCMKRDKRWRGESAVCGMVYMFSFVFASNPTTPTPLAVAVLPARPTRNCSCTVCAVLPAGTFYTLTTGSNERRWDRMKDKLQTTVRSFQLLN